MLLYWTVCTKGTGTTAAAAAVGVNFRYYNTVLTILVVALNGGPIILAFMSKLLERKVALDNTSVFKIFLLKQSIGWWWNDVKVSFM